MCNTGMKQSPIDIMPGTVEQLPEALQINFTYPSITGISVANKGNALQVDFTGYSPENEQALMDSLPTLPAAGDGVSAVFGAANGPTTEIKIIPIQFHFHAVSEHTLDGLYYPMETHIVHLVAEGTAPPAWGCDKFWQTQNADDIVLEKCAAVVGTFWKYGAASPPWLKTILQEAPAVSGESANSTLQSFDLMNLIPQDSEFFTYEGSLTTPGCNEGLRWHVMAEPLEVAPEDMEALQMWQANTKANPQPNAPIAIFRDDHRPIQALNGRSVWYSGPLPVCQQAVESGDGHPT
eukprot:TRINITY_DN85_c0_g1_i6.p2 TRINITY_DN85_c0_g1~~TRINITY_DN85_c0_g1_i6.p2  ORF type:complete len:293 (-),score=35.18 TRINITY_DN85_c0_g1_i6:756-1634(-)